ncbi:hypothetical protein MYAM1_000691 [Malassezia yamatoensis]|uniref:AB hydrolase-1 domain-containing protein n=1 Tax=Malassezia yamatoensis TaxID=253288 RepID=A0AAJ5YSH3_9BASI|nr:hypothetical protein MYAM1_000691 [Malassezia yamatoensis]
MQIREPPRIVAKVLVLAVWGITPLSWTYFLLYVLLRALFTPSWAETFGHIRTGSLPGSIRRALGRWAVLFSSPTLFAYTTTEAVFSVFYQYLNSRVQAKVTLGSATRSYVTETVANALFDGLSDSESEEFVAHPFEHDWNTSQLPSTTKTLDYDDPRAVAFRESMMGWFIGLTPDQVTELDIREWLSWALFGKYYEQVLDDDRHEEPKQAHDLAKRELAFLEEVVKLFAARSGIQHFPKEVQLTDAQQRAKRTMLLSLDPVRVSARPLSFYVIVRILNEFMRRMLKWRYNAQLYDIGSVQYLLYMPNDWSAEAAKKGEKPLPTLFLHGLGFGPVQYTEAISYLLSSTSSHRSRPVLIPLQPWTSYDLFSPRFLRPWNKEESARLIRGMLQRHGMYDCGVSVLSHSMGTIVHAWLLKEIPETIRRSIFVDPVCFQLWTPQICYRFLYKRPESFVEYILRYFIARELGIANVLTRYFDWTSNALLLDHIAHRDDPSRTRVYLAGEDTVVDAPALAQFFARNGMKNVVEYEKGTHHGAHVMGPFNRLPQIVSELDAPLNQL